jgi:catecholate siderophore receptor
MRSSIALFAATSLVALAAPASGAEAVPETIAASAAATADSAESDEKIVVEGQRDTYGVRNITSATKTNTPLRNVPQAVSVISASQIEDQQLRSIGEALYFVPGASVGTGEGNRDQIVLRGNSSTADFFIDGIRDDTQYIRDFYNVERMEVLKGPNAMIFGRGGGGGVINRVTKRSSLNSNRQLLASGDGFGGLRFTGDIDQPLGDKVGLRINGMYEDGDSFRQHVDLKRFAVNPSLGVMAGPDTRIDLGYEFLHDRRTADRGVPSLAAEPLEGFDRTFFGDPGDSKVKADVHLATLAVDHRFTERLTLRNRTMVGDYDKFYQNIFGNGLSAANLANPSEVGTQVVMNAYNNATQRRNLFSQTDLIWENRLAGIDQTMLFGFEIGVQKSRNRRQTGSFAGGDNRFELSDPTIDANIAFAPIASDANNRTRATVAAAYIQDQIRFSPMFELVGGLRFDSFKLNVDDLRPQVNREFSRRDALWSPRLGLVFKPGDRLSFYASYSRSYLPQSGDQFSGLDVNTESLKPERFDNYELGAKWEPVDGLLATAAVYQLGRANTRVANPDGSGTFLLSGEQRTRGVELGLERNINDDWQISAGYALQKAEVTKATTACPSGDCKLPLVPRHSLSLWTRYDVLDSLGFGLGVIARSKSYASIGNKVKLPGYARVDGAIYYKLLDAVEAQLNVENILNVDYFPSANGDNNIAPGAPRSIKGTVRFGI